MIARGLELAGVAQPWAAELDTVVELVRGQRAELVNVGHGRDPGSTARALAFIQRWGAVGGEVGAVVSWPATAASWLRPACRLAFGSPDAWVIADRVPDWVGLGRRLAATGSWRPGRTVAFAGLASPQLPELVGPEAVEGLRGAAQDGAVWSFIDGELRFGSGTGS